jgi:dTDP-3-amino-3,4,6-trideoxy-alpha-D-glucose transaminase
MIPQAAPGLRLARFRTEIDAAIAAVLGGGTYILGIAVEAFEQAFATQIGVGHCIGVASGTDALTLTFRALDIGPGDEVILPALTFAATAQAVLQCGALPRLVDVDPHTRCIDPEAVEAAVNAKTAALLPVHLHGYPADMPALTALAERHGLAVIEDCAQAHGGHVGGRSLGSFGHAAAFSFYPTKNLGCVGDGGAILTNDPLLAERVRILRNYGFEDAAKISASIGFNSRLDELQAAILLALLPHLDSGNAERRAIAARYRALLSAPQLGLPPDAEGCVYYQFAITHPERDALMRRLARHGIASAIHYTPGLHRHPAFSHCAAGPLPVTDSLAATLISLPIQPEVATPDVVEQVTQVIQDCASRWVA